MSPDVEQCRHHTATEETSIHVGYSPELIDLIEASAAITIAGGRYPDFLEAQTNL
ncbi:hypothetical protein [Kribbella kalugense]|uniref:Uncharacterized protein n=1 Tax=Kribbella kalugense TaxID=2512221 RepID=A0A4R7ZUU1_9ACTN|nr:hypothetical protein [Kribbella kalugense]TDW21837.1 hypothetical protein EV650_0668 [Kribbella kalugense]